MSQFFLIPGAWIGAWAWSEVEARLQTAGHEVHAITLPGVADRADEAEPAINLTSHIDDVVRLIEAKGKDDVVLVGHSYGGLVAEGVLSRIPERISTVVYVDTGPLPDGWSMLDFAGEGRADLETSVRERGDGWLLPFPGLDGLGTPAAVGDLDETQRARLAERATSQPFGTYQEGVPPARPFNGEYERVVIVAGGFGMPIAQLREMIGPDGPFSEMTGDDWKAVRLEAGHWPMLSAPDELATLLDGIATGDAALEPLNRSKD